RNALVESFMLHLRHVVDFLVPQQVEPADVIAADFCPGGWSPTISLLLEAARLRARQELDGLSTGRISGTFSRRNWDLTPLDAGLRTLLARFVERASPTRLSPKIRTLIGDSRILPLEDPGLDESPTMFFA